MADYMASLDRLSAIGTRAYLPGHGGPVVDGPLRVAELKRHREGREAAILRALEGKERTIEEVVAAVYIGLDPALAGAAALSVKAHVDWLEDRGLVWTKEGRLSRV
jgi:hydroxyacylglutathione hydrolase